MPEAELVRKISKKKLKHRGECAAPCFEGAEKELEIPTFISCKQVTN